MTEPIVETPAPGVALVRLNRPEALNALNMAVRRHLAGDERAEALLTRLATNLRPRA